MSPANFISLARRFITGAAGTPYQTMLAVFLTCVGLYDAFGPNVYPPEVAGAAPGLVFRAYGLYLAVGATLVLIGGAYRYERWAVRLEKAGHVAIVTSMLFFASVLGLFSLNGAPTETQEAVAGYLRLAATLTLIASAQRWWWLRKQGYLRVPFPRCSRKGCRETEAPRVH